MKKNIIILLIIITWQVNAATIFVGNGGCTLNDAIRAANADAARGNCTAGDGADVINIPDNSIITITSPLASLTTPMTIETTTDSGNALIFGDGSSRVMRIANANNVSLRNITLSGGRLNALGSSGGAGILITNSSVNLFNVHINANTISTGTKIGAGMKIDNNSNVTIEQSTISNNQITLNLFGTDNARGGNIAVIDSILTINNTTLSGCLGPFAVQNCAEKGSGIYLDNSNLTLSNSLLTFHENYDNLKGADIYAINNSSVVVNNSTFYNNYNFHTGSRIFLQDSEIDINNVTIHGDNTSSGGFETINSTVSSSNSIFYMFRSTAIIHPFCKAFDSNNNPIPFNLLVDINNLSPLDDSSCGVTPIFFDASSFNVVTAPVDKGGFTYTSALRPSSNNAAINTGDAATCESLDQRGMPRDATCDIGAYELTDITDLSIDMHINSPSPRYRGQQLEYEIEVFNDGPSDAYGVEVFISEFGLSVDSFEGNHNCVISVTGYTCTIDAIANGASAVILMHATIEPVSLYNAEAIVHNITLFSSDPSLGNNTDDTGNGGGTVPAADLAVTHRLLNQAPYFVGQQLTYEIEVENLGLSTATVVNISNNVDGLNNITYTGCDSTTSNTCVINTIGIGNSGAKTISMTAKITGSEIKNTSIVNANEFDPIMLNNTTSLNNNVATDSDLSVSMSLLTSGIHYPSDYLQYRVKITNNGPDPATNIILTNFQGDNLVITDGDNTCMVLPCTIPVMLNGETKNIILGGFVGFPGGFNVKHRVTVISDQNDGNQVDNEVTVISHIDHAADIQTTINLLTAGIYYSETQVQFEIIVKNNGSTPASMVEILGAPTNLIITQVSSTNCFNLPCSLSGLEIGANNQETITIHAFIVNQGNFKINASATAVEHDDLPSNNYQSDGGIATLNPNDMIFENGFE